MPGIQCVVAFCKSNAFVNKKEDEKISFHKFPKDDYRRKKWIKFCRREKAFNPDTSCICSKHFNKTDYENNDVEYSIKKELNMDVKVRLKASGKCFKIFILNYDYLLVISSSLPFNISNKSKP